MAIIASRTATVRTGRCPRSEDHPTQHPRGRGGIMPAVIGRKFGAASPILGIVLLMTATAAQAEPPRVWFVRAGGDGDGSSVERPRRLHGDARSFDQTWRRHTAAPRRRSAPRRTRDEAGPVADRPRGGRSKARYHQFHSGSKRRKRDRARRGHAGLGGPSSATHASGIVAINVSRVRIHEVDISGANQSGTAPDVRVAPRKRVDSLPGSELIRRLDRPESANSNA